MSRMRLSYPSHVSNEDSVFVVPYVVSLPPQTTGPNTPNTMPRSRSIAYVTPRGVADYDHCVARASGV